MEELRKDGKRGPRKVKELRKDGKRGPAATSLRWKVLRNAPTAPPSSPKKTC